MGDYSEWWAQHNEHRIVLSKVFFWIDIRWFGGLSYSLITINYLLVSAACVIFITLLNEAFRSLPSKELRSFFIFILVGWLFSWSQHENLSWAFQSQFFMAQLLPLLAFYFLYKMSSASDKSLMYFLLACIFGVLSIGTMANGILALPLMFVYGVFCRIGVRRNSVLFVLATICIFFYFYDYKAPGGHGSLVDVITNNPLGLVQYMLLYIGGPFSFIFSVLSIPLREGVAALAGLFFIAVTAFCAYLNIRSTQRNYLHLCLLFYIIYFGGTALGTAGGRLMLGGVEQALSSRYSTPALMAWVALLIIVMPVLVRWTEKRKIVLPAFLALSIAVLVGQANALDSKVNESFERLVAVLSLELQVNDRNQILHVFPSAAWVLDVAKFPSEKHLSIFGIDPILGAKEKIGTTNTLSTEKQCIGSLDQILPIAGEDRYATVNGWFFDKESESSPSSLLIVDQKNVVVGYALAGGERDDVARLIDSKALYSQFKGYVLKESLGSNLKFASNNPRCYFDTPTHPMLYSFNAVNPNINSTSLMVADVINGSEWTGSDSWHSKLDGLTVIGSWRQSDADTGSVVLRVKRGDKLLYRSGPTGGRQTLQVNDDPSTRSILPVATEWIALDFSGNKYPDNFKIKVSDDGDGWGEWSAIALKTEHN
ncbi:hypothetical protein OH720_08670 [Pseudomonas sp. WJP1]|uniref:hypothetical protein n=1 Tax=Pseudomonas sp. WJP1 TaxID=2986947 RepID=UPI00234A2344|nr:hypothetical protein [Pseudomonas sp. WJP1]WCM53069.1 hypothetical protein OH720_08670 [Pseudomonas sp. WJP1]